KTAIEKYAITSNYSYVKASHTMYDGVKISRTVIFFHDGAIYFHDQIESNKQHSYSQIFNIGPNVIIDDSDPNNLILSSKIDNSSLTLTQINPISEFVTYNGSENPVRGWQSTTFNEVNPITNLNYIIDGDNIAFETIINLGNGIQNVENFHSGDSHEYVFEFEDNRTERIEIYD
ncbi:MAG: heparinase II/III family protein, partial [Candidatus Thermoplasmatota archaeon]|nr:heparinase II/III family protein [Candidatus Thermoplasmatota archaeon]